MKYTCEINNMHKLKCVIIPNTFVTDCKMF